MSRSFLPADTNRWAVAGLVPGRRRWWWTRANLAAARRCVYAESQLFLNSACHIVFVIFITDHQPTEKPLDPNYCFMPSGGLLQFTIVFIFICIIHFIISRQICLDRCGRVVSCCDASFFFFSWRFSNIFIKKVWSQNSYYTRPFRYMGRSVYWNFWCHVTQKYSYR